MKQRLLCAVLICLAQTGHCGPIEEVRGAIAERLMLMTDVARYKWNAQLPVTDLDREVALLPRLIETAVDVGLDPGYADRVVRAQMAAARAQQEHLIAQWQAAAASRFDAVPDLVLVTRPAITTATTRLLASLHAHLCALGTDPEWGPPPADIDEHAWAIATTALLPAPADTCPAH